MTPFSLRVFVADGDPDGLRLVERSNWNGKAVMFPRTLLPSIKAREEFSQAGIYLLIGPRVDGEGEMLYVGEGDPVRPRLESHFSQKDFWTKAVLFVAGSYLNKAHVQFLESQLIQQAKVAKKVPLENIIMPTEPTLSEADRADMQVFLSNMLGILPVLGVHAFESTGSASSDNTAPILSCRGKGAIATGYESTKGFVVKASSQAVLDTVPSMQEHVKGPYDLRQELIKNGVLVPSGDYYEFSQDYVFSSPSTAAAVVLGRSSNGRVEWKDASGRTLKVMQEQQV